MSSEDKILVGGSAIVLWLIINILCIVHNDETNKTYSKNILACHDAKIKYDLVRSDPHFDDIARLEYLMDNKPTACYVLISDYDAKGVGGSQEWMDDMDAHMMKKVIR